jgi:hypothetical protein
MEKDRLRKIPGLFAAGLRSAVTGATFAIAVTALMTRQIS